VKRREIIKLGFLAPLIAAFERAFERAFGWLLPDRWMRGWQIYLDGAEQDVSFGDVTEVDFEADKPFQAGFWFKTPRGSRAGATTQGKKKAGIPKLKISTFKILRRCEVDDGEWHHIVCRYNGSNTPPKNGSKVYL